MNADHQRQVLHGALALSMFALMYMFWSFSTVILADMVLVLVTWPVYKWMLERIGRAVPAALATTALVVGMVLIPLGFALYLGVREAVDAGNELVEYIATGGLRTFFADLEMRMAGPWSAGPWTDGAALADRVGAGLEQAVGSQVQAVGLVLTGGFALLLEGLLHLGIGVILLATLYLEGPSLVIALKRFGPLDDAHIDRLLKVFDQLAHNMAYGMVATSVGQGGVAAVGFWLVGAERVALLGIGTAIASQVPLVGSAVVWAPLAIAFAMDGKWWQAAFVIGWSLILTASVDNVLKPLIYRHGLPVHPVLFLLAILGGLTTFGPKGVLIGPLVLVLCMTLYTLYIQSDVPKAA